MPTFDSLVKKKLNNLEEIPDEFISVVEKQQKKVLEEIIDSLSELKTVDGSIDVSEANIVKIQSIVDNAKKVFFDKEYVKALASFSAAFDSQAALTNKLIEAGLGPITNDKLFKQILRSSQENALQLFSEAVIDTVYFEPLKQQLFLNITTGASLSETIKAVRLITTGGENGKAILSDYAKTYSRTSFSQADAIYSNTVSKEMGGEWFQYAGSAIETTRPFCDTRHNKYYHEKEVESWGDLDPWSGQIKGTDTKTIFANRGGWNCRHQLITVSVFMVPKDVVRRAINKGYYKPTKGVQEWLGKAA